MRRIACVLALALVGALVAVPAMAGGPGTPITEGSKSKSGPWKKVVFSKGLRTSKFYMRVTNTHSSDQTAVLTEQSVGPGVTEYRFRWFKGKQDISHDVQTSGYEFSLPEGSKRKFKVKAKPREDRPKAACLYANVQVDDPTTGVNGPFFALRKREACQA